MKPTPTRFLLVHGDADRHVPIAQGQRLHAALGSVGDDATLIAVEDGDHFFAQIDADRVTALVDTTAEFILGAHE